MSAKSTVDELKPADLPAATASLAAAFADYPLIRAITTERGRADGCTAFCRMMVNYSLRYGAAYSTAGHDAVACWLEPGREWFSLGRLVRAGALSLAWRLGLRRAGRLEQISRTFDTRRRGHVPGRHWYLNLLGVRPEAQGKGLSRAVVEPVFALADRGRLPCYLETQHEGNLAIYERLGFELKGVSELTATLRNWEMVRLPR